MRLTFKVGFHRSPVAVGTVSVLTLIQDLKQQKFVIEAEPSELVRSLLYPHQFLSLRNRYGINLPPLEVC
jgi:hypothetical protein